MATGAVKLTGSGEGSLTATEGVVDSIAVGTAAIEHPHFVSFD
jgi:hypothetical protein